MTAGPQSMLYFNNAIVHDIGIAKGGGPQGACPQLQMPAMMIL